MSLPRCNYKASANQHITLIRPFVFQPLRRPWVVRAADGGKGSAGVAASNSNAEAHSSPAAGGHEPAEQRHQEQQEEARRHSSQQASTSDAAAGGAGLNQTPDVAQFDENLGNAFKPPPGQAPLWWAEKFEERRR